MMAERPSRTFSHSTYTINYTLEDGGDQATVVVPVRKLNASTLKEMIGYGISELMEVGRESFESFLPAQDGSFSLPFTGTYFAVLNPLDPFIPPLRSNLSHHDIVVAQTLILQGDRRDEMAACSRTLGVVAITTTRPYADLPCLIATCHNKVVLVVSLTASIVNELLECKHYTELKHYGPVNDRALQLAGAVAFESITELVQNIKAQVGEAYILVAGQGLSGSVAHVLACHLRNRFQEVDETIAVQTCSFRSPSLMGYEAACAIDRLYQSDHLTIVDERDCWYRLCKQVHQLAGLTNKRMQSQLCPDVVRDTQTLEHTVDQMKLTEQIERLQRQLDLAQTLLEQHTGPALPQTSPFGTFRLANKQGINASLPATTADELLSRIAMSSQTFRPVSITASHSSDLLVGTVLAELDLTAVVTNILVIASGEHIEILLEGSHLDFCLKRSSTQGHVARLPVDVLQPQLAVAVELFEGAQLEGGPDVHAYVKGCATDRVKIQLAPFHLPREQNYDDEPLSVTLYTDFGPVASHNVGSSGITRTDGLDGATMLLSGAGHDLLTTAWIRALLLESKQESVQTVAEGDCRSVVGLLSLLEQLLLDGASLPYEHKLTDLYLQYVQAPKPEQAQLAMSKANRLNICEMLKVLQQPLELQPETQLQRHARRALCRFGQLVSGVFFIVGVAAIIPAVIVAMPVMLVKDAEAVFESRAMRVATAPADMFGTMTSALFRASVRGLKEQPSRQYIAVLKFLLAIMGVDAEQLFETIPTLEDALMATLADAGRGNLVAMDESGIVDDILIPVFLQYGQDDNHPASVLRSVSHCKKLAHQLRVVACMHALRSHLASQLVVTFTGVHNVGKSTAIKRLFGIDTNPDALVRTLVPGVYPIRSQEDRTGNLSLAVVDMPGTDEKDQGAAHMFKKFGSMSTFVVVIVAAGHVAGPEKKVVEEVQALDRPFMVVVNKCDGQIADGEEREDFAQRYALDLSLPRSSIVMTSLGSNDDDLEGFRHMLFDQLSAMIHAAHLDTLAEKLAPTDFSVVLSRVPAVDASIQCRRSVARSVMDSGEPFTPESITAFAQAFAAANTCMPATKAIKYLRAVLQRENFQGFLIDSFTNMLHRQVLEGGVDSDFPKSNNPSLDILLGRLQQLNNHPDEVDVHASVIECGIQLARSCQARLEELHESSSTPALRQHALRVVEELYKPHVHPRPRRRVTLRGLARHGSRSTPMLTALRRRAPSLSSLGFRPSFIPGGISRRQALTSKQLSTDSTFEERRQVFLKSLSHKGNKYATIQLPSRVDKFAAFLQALADVKASVLQVDGLMFKTEGGKSIDGSSALQLLVQMAVKFVKTEHSGFLTYDRDQLYLDPRVPVSSDEAGVFLHGWGRLLGLVVRNEHVNLPLRFSPVFYKMLLKRPLACCHDDLLKFWVRAADLVSYYNELSDEEFAAERLGFYTPQEANQVEAGIALQADPTQPVTPRLRHKYIQALLQFYLASNWPLERLSLGFAQTVKPELIALFSPIELELLIVGSTHIHAAPEAILQLMQHNSQQEGLSEPSSVTQQHFATALGSLSEWDRALFVGFITGNVSPPQGSLLCLQPPLRWQANARSPCNGKFQRFDHCLFVPESSFTERCASMIHAALSLLRV